MKLLEAEPTPAAGTAAAPPSAPAGPQGAAVAARACSACGAPMQAEQDWCLSCGTAAPGRLGQRPGWRAAATIAALTLVHVAGSVAAASAALTTDATQEAAAPAPPAAGPVAQAPPATPPSSATPPPPKPLPAVEPPASSSPSAGGTVTPVSPPATSSPAPVQPVTPVTPSTGSGGSTQADTPPAKPGKPAGPVMIELPGDAGSVYDPDTQAVDPGDPSLALDGDKDTAFDVAAQSTAWGMGYVVDLQSKRGLRAVRIDTDTPGFKVEVYATDLRTPPPSITDTRWAHLRNAADVGTEKGRTTVKLGDGTEKYRTLLLWITAGPAAGDRVDLGEVTVLG
ncbi:MAG TPA: hypothetical protein VLA98_15845 [Solirubrobacteraceae bacterium]|nr:hypothetical protein [Solirubrobacteraceae bacterium]